MQHDRTDSSRVKSWREKGEKFFTDSQVGPMDVVGLRQKMLDGFLEGSPTQNHDIISRRTEQVQFSRILFFCLYVLAVCTTQVLPNNNPYFSALAHLVPFDTESQKQLQNKRVPTSRPRNISFNGTQENRRN